MKIKTKKQRSGAAIIELAICLPVLVLLVWGSIELTSAMFLKQTLTSAAHEGAMTGMRLNATEADVRDRVDLILDSREVDNCNVTIAPSGTAFEDMESGDAFSITISKGQTNSFVNITAVSVQVSSQKP